MCLRSCAGFPDVLVVHHDAKLSVRCSASSREWARASSSFQPTTRTPTPRSRAPTASSATPCRLRQRQQGRLGQSPHARRVRHQQCYLHALRQPDALLDRPRRAPSPPALSATRRQHRWKVAGALRAADAGYGDDGAGAARGGARSDLSRFSHRFSRIFPGEALNPIFSQQIFGISSAFSFLTLNKFT